MTVQTMRYPLRAWWLGVAVLGVTVLLSSPARAAAQQGTLPKGAAIASWHENGQGGRYVLQLVRGKALPAGQSISGVVISDTNCQADAAGLSHCNNTIELANGSRITVVNNHEMMRYRCLHPGERVSLKRLDAAWVVGVVSGG